MASTSAGSEGAVCYREQLLLVLSKTVVRRPEIKAAVRKKLPMLTSGAIQQATLLASILAGFSLVVVLELALRERDRAREIPYATVTAFIGGGLMLLTVWFGMCYEFAISQRGRNLLAIACLAALSLGLIACFALLLMLSDRHFLGRNAKLAYPVLLVVFGALVAAASIAVGL